MAPDALRRRLMRLKKKIARVKFKNGRSHQGLLTYLDDTDCWSIRGRTLTASIVFQLIEVVNVFAISERGSSTSAFASVASAVGHHDAISLWQVT
jgi:hypothetical protein